ncbi:carboxypeptidase-like regulatory domain-containing protein, partial [Streptomyces longispororuber]|uniref:carboxypeptidase-like regulatory domain-containing protein n=1 Tax=Streptomyces longispororuber TaxID=68230 RepID=UPI00210CB8A4
ETPVPTALPVHRHHFGDPDPVLTGVVRDAGQDPVRGAAVVVLDGGGRQLVSTVTDAQGRYAVAGLPEGHVGVVASAPGRHPVARRRQVRPGETTEADFTLRGRAADLAGAGAEAPSSQTG